ncbi:TRAP transporter small permease subunit [uncultured Desulfosarcina sp.]|uniref:TRAP transporter small permease subunit n=1 Tax=uncultured Desulfosarcina sp. TaxID=218289 RepID=UPI0029C96D80|nr:TRAP transporter small permease subunit [uncultured Desulfosarcina sp.]
MGFLKYFIKSIDTTNAWIGRLAHNLLFVIFSLLLVEVFRRYLFNAPTTWANELVQLIFGAYAILTGGEVLRINGHVNVDILYAKFPPKTRAACDIVTSIMFFLFAGMFIWMGWEMAWESLSRFETSESAWNPPIWPFKMMIPIGGALLFLQGVSKLIQNLYILLGIRIEAKTEVQGGHPV